MAKTIVKQSVKTKEEITKDLKYVLSTVEEIKKANKKPSKKGSVAIIDLIGQIQALEKTLSDCKDELKAVVKDYMIDKDLSELVAETYVAKYSEYESEGFDTTRFKKEKPKMYEKFLKTTPKTRFTVDAKKVIK